MKKKNTLIDTAKDTLKVGTTVMVGHGIIGGLSNVPGMPAQASTAAQAAGAGLNLVAIGQLGKVGMGLTNQMMPETKKMKPKTDNEKRITKILGR